MNNNNSTPAQRSVGFASEADMLVPVTAGARLFLSRHRRQREFKVFYELPVGHGVADVVIVQFDDGVLQQRLAVGVGPVEDHLAVRVLTFLHAAPLTLGELALAVRASTEHLRRAILPRLSEDGWVVRGRSGIWGLEVPYAPVARTIVALELKRRDWRLALGQARRYARFANQTYAVVDAAMLGDASTWPDEIGDGNIGLATVDAQTSRVRILASPQWQAPLSPAEFALGAERAWSLAMQGQRSGPVRHVFGVQRTATATLDPRLPSAWAGCPR